MSAPEFDRADYIQPTVTQPTFEGQPVNPASMPGYGQPYAQQPMAPAFDNASAAGSTGFVKALLFGIGGALLGSLGWGLVGLSGFMVSIIAIGIGYLVGRAMMTGTGGVGGRTYQIMAVVLTYLGCVCGRYWDYLWFYGHQSTGSLNPAMLIGLAIEAFISPFTRFNNPINGILGIVILFFGLRTAWRIAAGSPGFGQTGPAVSPFGLR